jgi:hypothetical protein
VEVVVRHAVRSDVCGALFETHRALEVLLTWLVLRGCDLAQDEEGNDPNARSQVLFHRFPFCPSTLLPVFRAYADDRRRTRFAADSAFR